MGRKVWVRLVKGWLGLSDAVGLGCFDRRPRILLKCGSRILVVFSLGFAFEGIIGLYKDWVVVLVMSRPDLEVDTWQLSHVFE